MNHCSFSYAESSVQQSYWFLSALNLSSPLLYGKEELSSRLPGLEKKLRVKDVLCLALGEERSVVQREVRLGQEGAGHWGWDCRSLGLLFQVPPVWPQLPVGTLSLGLPILGESH